MGKVKNKSIGKKVISAGTGLIPGGGIAKLALKGAGSLLSRKGTGRKKRKKSMFSTINKLRKQSIIEKEKARLMKIKLSAYK